MSEAIVPEEPFDLVPADAFRGAVGRFQLKTELARGHLGISFLAYDPKVEQDVALFLPDVPVGKDWPPVLHAAFALNHPNVIGVKEFGIESGRHYVVAATSPGQPLTQWLAAGRPGVRQAVSWARDLALALHFAHERGTFHGGVHAGVIVIDKGRARLSGFAMTHPPVTAVSPEQARGSAGSPAGDQYSLGVVLYELLVGQHPHGPDPRQVLSKTGNIFTKPEFPRDHNPAIPFALEAVLLRAIEKEPGDRYASAADLAVDLQRLLNGDWVDVKIRTPAQGAPPRDCPVCKRRGMGEKPRCLYCDRDLIGLDPVPRDETVENDEKPKLAVSTRTGLGLVKLGLGFHMLRMVCYILCLLSLIAAAMLTTTMPQWVEYALLTAAVLMVPPPAFGLLGSFFAAFVPGRARARVWIAISLVLEVAGVVAGTVPGVAAADPQLVPEPLFVPAAALLSVVLGFLAWVFLLVYLDRLADYLDRPGAAADALGMIVRGLLYAAAPIAIGAAAFGLGLLLPDFAYIFGFAAVVAIVVWLFKAVRFVFEYLEVLKVLREAIAEKIAKPKRR